ncbi:tetratricopeptide repeat protein [Actinoplanes sp. NPDC020271]|uniref:tetratricopeptide repeat protein n=1 Tax=Actinoplanes sp. NPDC020271 TaxID=3363896 RepID=UPI0037BA39B9
MTDATPSRSSAEPDPAPASAWPLPSSAPTLSPAPAIDEATELPVPYAAPSPGHPDETHLVAQGEPPLVAAAHVAVVQLRFADAIRLLEEFLGEHPDDSRAWHRLAGARLGLGQYHLALTYAERSVALDPESPAAHRFHGLALFYLGRTIEAERSAARSIQLDPSVADAHALLAQALARLGRTEDALAAARVALALAPGQVAALDVISRSSSSAVRWMPLVTAGTLPAGLLLGVLALTLADAPSVPIYAGFAVMALLPAFAAIVRYAVSGRLRTPAQPLPRVAFAVTPVLSAACVAIPVLISGTRPAGALFAVLVAVLLGILAVAAVYRAAYPARRPVAASPAPTVRATGQQDPAVSPASPPAERSPADS